ncbi:MAG: 2-methylthioadenine synthetase, partial [Bacteroidetes bacterium]|nr:2-methylthioadenine synthetase [Bacteroidota bacterium]
MKRIALHTLGCKLNFAETSSIARQFSQSGYQPVNLDESADVVLIHTCSVTERADRECRQLVRRALRKSPDAFVIVAGCYAQLRPHEISEIEGVDLVLGTNEKFNAFSHGGDFRKKSKPEILV